MPNRFIKSCENIESAGTNLNTLNWNISCYQFKVFLLSDPAIFQIHVTNDMTWGFKGLIVEWLNFLKTIFRSKKRRLSLRCFPSFWPSPFLERASSQIVENKKVSFYVNFCTKKSIFRFLYKKHYLLFVYYQNITKLDLYKTCNYIIMLIIQAEILWTLRVCLWII